MGLDELDEAILHHLERHGRATNYEVGEAVGLSASAASRRILALEAAGAIRGYCTQIDDRLLGKRMTVFIRVTLERQSAPVLSAFEAAVRKSIRASYAGPVAFASDKMQVPVGK